MKGIAQISFQGGGLFLPAKTPYERELLLEHAKMCTRRHGRVRLALNQHEWTVTRTEDDEEQCSSCGRPLDSLKYAYAGRNLCTQCARAALS